MSDSEHVNPAACAGGARDLELALLDQVVSRFFDTLVDGEGAERLYLVGGSSQALVLAALGGQPLRMRDFDVAILGITPKKERMVRAAERLGLGQVSDLRPRPRGTINAGYGLYVNHPQIGVLDLIFFKDGSAFKMNGIYSVDTIAFCLCPRRLPRHRAVSTLFERLAREGTGPLMAEGLLRDRFGGVQDLLHRRIRFVRRGRYVEKVSERANCIIRGVKLAAQWGVRFSDPTINGFLSAADPALREACTSFSSTRNLAKMLTSERLVQHALAVLRGCGALGLFLPELAWVERSHARWAELQSDLCATIGCKGRRPGAADLIDGVTRRLGAAEWRALAARIEPILGREIVENVAYRRALRRALWLASLNNVFRRATLAAPSLHLRPQRLLAS